MRNLVEFLNRFGTFFLFITLEAVCFFLIASTDTEKEQSMISSAQAVAGFVSKKFFSVTSYFGLKKENEILQAKYNELLAQQDNALYFPQFEIDTAALQVRRQDSIYSQARRRDSLAMKDTMVMQMYDFIPANVISKSVNLQNMTLTLDKGGLQGVAPRMGVLGSNGGIVGIVLDTSRHYASVMSVLHSQVSISASIRDKGYFGSLVWRGNDPQRMYLEAVPKHAVIEVKDTLETSGFSGIFPAGIFIGIVDKINTKDGDNFYTIHVKLNADLTRLRHVHVVRHKWLEEMRKLEKQAN